MTPDEIDLTPDAFKEELRNVLREAFFLGFSISRGGFNAETAFPEHAPSTLIKTKDSRAWATTDELRKKMLECPEFIELRDQMEKHLLP